jgi:PE-PPE domain-containing protein
MALVAPRSRAAVRSLMGAMAVALSCTALLAATPTMSTAVRLLTNAYVMDGTTFPTPSPGFITAALNDFIVPTLGGSYTGIALTTPEQAVGINQSVQDGLTDLQKVIADQQQADPGQPFVVFGYSQSAVITMLEKAALQQQKAAGQAVPNVTFVGIGVGNRPNGGIAERLGGFTIPFFDFTFNGAETTDAGIPTIDIARQYDGLADTPQFPIDPVADLNAVLGVVFVHLLYGETVSLNPASPNYVPGTTKQQDGDTTYYFIPTEQLPLLDPLRVAGVPEPVLDVVQPLLNVLVEAGYDRSIPFGQPTPAQLIPSIDPVTFGLQLASATLGGADNAAALVGAQLPGYAALSGLLTAAQSVSAAAIGAPYATTVSAINNAFNPIQDFDTLQGPVATGLDSVVNRLEVPKLLNSVIDAAVFPVTAWAEKNLLFPSSATSMTVSNTSDGKRDSVKASIADHRSAGTDRTRQGRPAGVHRHVTQPHHHNGAGSAD